MKIENNRVIFIVAAEIRRVSAASPSCVYMFCFPSPSHQLLSLQLGSYIHSLKDRTAVAGCCCSAGWGLWYLKWWHGATIWIDHYCLVPGPGLTREPIKISYKSQQDSLLLSTVHTSAAMLTNPPVPYDLWQVGAFSVIVQLCRLMVYSTSPHTGTWLARLCDSRSSQSDGLGWDGDMWPSEWILQVCLFWGGASWWG